MVIGLTGGIGCGKTAVLKYLEQAYGALIIEADRVAKDLYNPGSITYEKIVKTFGRDILDGEIINRKRLADIVFDNSEKLNALNDIVHPTVKQEIIKKISTSKAEDSDRMIVIEAALLIETGYDKICDKLIYVYCDREVRIERLINGRGFTREDAEYVIGNQLSEEEYFKNTDAVIDNSGSVEECIKNTEKVIQKIRRNIMKTISTNKAPAAIGPYSQAVITNGLLFTSGQIALDPASGNVVGSDVVEQTEQVMKNLGAILEEAGASYEKAVKTTCFLADINDFAAFNEVYGKYFVNKPARSCVAVKDLPKGVLVEVEVIAEV